MNFASLSKDLKKQFSLEFTERNGDATLNQYKRLSKVIDSWADAKLDRLFAIVQRGLDNGLV